jgi:hypothetical protein
MKTGVHRDRTVAARTVGVLTLVVFSLPACGKGVEIVKAPLISPIVVPAPDVFRMNVAVKNFGSQPSADLWLRVYSEYWPKANPAANEPPCSQTEYLRAGVIDPGKSWAASDYRIDRGSGCACLKNMCPGHVWLSLHTVPTNGPHINGENTALHVNWAADGDLSKLTITAF